MPGPHAARRLPADPLFPLVGRWVVLQNLSSADAPELAAVWRPALFSHMLDWPDDETVEGTRACLRRFLRRPGIRTFVIRLQADPAPCGITGLVDLRPVERCAEVCCTLLLPPYRGGVVFPETVPAVRERLRERCWQHAGLHPRELLDRSEPPPHHPQDAREDHKTPGPARGP